MVERRGHRWMAEELTSRGTSSAKSFMHCPATTADHMLRYSRHTFRRGPPENIRFLSVQRWR